MARKWTESDEAYWGGEADTGLEGPPPDRYYLVQKYTPQLSFKLYIDLIDTIICSFSRYDELDRLMKEKPFDERSTVIASQAVNHTTVYYVNENGHACRFFIEED